MSMLAILGMVLSSLLAQDQPAATTRPPDSICRPPVDGAWQAWLESPGGDVPFTLELRSDQRGRHAALQSGDGKRFAANKLSIEGSRLVLEWTDLASQMSFEISDGGLALDGSWEHQRDAKHRARLPCRARFGLTPQASIPITAFLPPAPGGAGLPPLAERGQSCAPRYRLTFQGDQTPSVAVLQEEELGGLSGTVLTVFGDLRGLQGRRTGSNLELWGFDGARAWFLRARQAADGSLRGEAWADHDWQRTWQAEPDPSAALPDPTQLTKLRSSKLPALAFDDLQGQTRRLDHGLLGDATLVLLFGAWHPNCHEAARLIDELSFEFADRGLRVVGLAFEPTADKALGRAALQAFAERHKLAWPILLAGTVDREAAALPCLDKLAAYPTVLFVDKTANIRAAHAGFTSKAAREEHALLVDDWRKRITELLR